MSSAATPLLIYATEDGRIQIAAQVSAETLWLTQPPTPQPVASKPTKKSKRGAA